jgi:PIN domain
VWKNRLSDDVRRLQQLDAFVNQPGLAAILDTSAFIEGGNFWEQDWPAITGADDQPPPPGAGPRPVCLIVPILVIEEMDNQKRHPNKRVQAAARQTLSHLWRLPRESYGARRLNPRVTVQVLLDDPGHARMAVNDMEIVDRAA